MKPDPRTARTALKRRPQNIERLEFLAAQGLLIVPKSKRKSGRQLISNQRPWCDGARGAIHRGLPTAVFTVITLPTDFNSVNWPDACISRGGMKSAHPVK